MAETTAGSRSMMAGGKEKDLRKPERMEEKMREREEEEVGGRQRMLKCRVNRGVRCDRPPPGGAAAPIKTVF